MMAIMTLSKKALGLALVAVIPVVFWSTNLVQAQTTGAIFNSPISVFVSGNYAYVTSESVHTLEIVDISNPALPAHKGSIVNNVGGAVLAFPSSVAVSGNYAYITSRFGNSLEVFDISDPANPVYVSTLHNGDGGAVLRCPTSLSISGNYAYMISTGCANANPTAVEIVDISDSTNPTHVNSYFEGSLAGINSLAISGNYLYLTFVCFCNGGGGIRILDISNPALPVSKGSIFDGTDGTNLSHPTDIYVSGNYIYVTNGGSISSFEIFDISDPINIVYKGSIQDGDGGAEFLNPTNVVVSGNYAYMTAYGDNGLEIVNVSDPTNPTHAGRFDYSLNFSYPYGVFVSGNYAYVTLINENALDIIDISNPSNPVRKGIIRNGELVGIPPAPVNNPVIIIPGIMGSILINDDLTINKERWPNLPLMVLPGSDSYLDEIKLSSLGISEFNIISSDLIRELEGHDFFAGLIKTLLQSGISNSQELFENPYDWRIDIQTISNELKNKIEQIKSETGSMKVDIIAHSMGGLIVKQYLKDYGGDFIGKFIDVGTPHLGSPKAFKILQYGDDMGFRPLNISILNENRVKIISQNMPSVYELLPNSSYGNYIYDMDDLDNNGVRGSLSYADTKQFMENTGRNSALVDRADQFHQSIANLDPSDYGVETYNIVGCGVQTLGKIFILNKETSGGVEYNISYINGDGTVPLKSAENIPALKTYYAKNAVHATMPSTFGVKELIASILSDDPNFDISLYSNLAESANGCTVPRGKIVSFHSPIELHIYSGSHHAGPNADGDIEVNIPGVSYEVIDGNKFAFLPDGVGYTITGNATAAGTFNARIETVENENVIETRYFNQVPITSTTQVEVTEDKILIDNESDLIFESEFPVSSVLDEIESSDVTKPTTNVTVIGKRKKDEPYTAPVKVVLSATDDNSGVLKTEYSIDEGQSWILYIEPFTVSTRGLTHLLYRSTDRAGNVESPKFVDIDIAKKIK